ncbi:50S ribosomal protein L3 [Patescibacteria group bacterium]
MIPILLGRKVNQKQLFTEDGKRIPVTEIQVGPCWITKIINETGYQAYQIGFEDKKKLDKPTEGRMKQAGLDKKPRFFREIRVDQIEEEITVGKELRVEDVFHKGDSIRIIGTSKGKGFAGVMKRHGFAGGPRTHGQSDRARAPGSIGQSATPGRVYKGKKMAGRMGGERITQKGLQVIDINVNENILIVKGLIPGPKQGFVVVQVDKSEVVKQD